MLKIIKTTCIDIWKRRFQLLRLTYTKQRPGKASKIKNVRIVNWRKKTCPFSNVPELGLVSPEMAPLDLGNQPKTTV